MKTLGSGLFTAIYTSRSFWVQTESAIEMQDENASYNSYNRSAGEWMQVKDSPALSKKKIYFRERAFSTPHLH